MQSAYTVWAKKKGYKGWLPIAIIVRVLVRDD